MATVAAMDSRLRFTPMKTQGKKVTVDDESIVSVVLTYALSIVLSVGDVIKEINPLIGSGLITSS